MSESKAFKFELGQCLRHKAEPSNIRLFVVGRVMEECGGGVQLHYRCRIIQRESGMIGNTTAVERYPLQFLEIELVESAPFPALSEIRWGPPRVAGKTHDRTPV